MTSRGDLLSHIERQTGRGSFGLPDEPLSDDPIELLKQIAELQRRILDAVAHHPPGTLFWPTDGGVGFLTAGRNVFDFVNGTYTAADGTVERLSGSLGPGRPVMSVHFHPFNASSFSVLVEGGAQMRFAAPPVRMDRQHHVLTHVMATKITVFVTVPMAMFVQFSDEPEAPPIVPEGITAPDTWFGEATTTNDFVALTMRPSVFNPLTSINTILSAARAISGDPTQQATVVNTLYSRHTLWIVRNTHASNNAQVNLQGALSGNPADMADDPATGSTALVSAGDVGNILSERPYLFQRLRVEATVDGSQATIEARAHAIVGL